MTIVAEPRQANCGKPRENPPKLVRGSVAVLLLFPAVGFVASLKTFAAEPPPATLLANPSSACDQADPPSSPAKDAAFPFAQFIAEAGHEPPEAISAWRRYRPIVGDGKPARELFAAIAEGQPELCAAVDGDPKKLNASYIHHLQGLLQAIKEASMFNRKLRYGDYSVGEGNVAAMLLFAAQPEITLDKTDGHQLMDLLLKHLRLFFKIGNDPAPPRELRELLQKLALNWVTRTDDPVGFSTRLSAAQSLHLEEARAPLALRLLQHPELGGPAARGPSENIPPGFAVVTVAKLGDRKNIPLLAPYLATTARLDGAPVDTQTRDVVLGAIVEFGGGRPQEYGLVPADANMFWLPHVRIYVFETVEARNAGFAKCVANFKALGLSEPPPFQSTTPRPFRFLSRASGLDKGKPPQPKSPDGKVTLELHGHTARLIDIATGVQIGSELSAGEAGKGEQLEFLCWSFSPDGKTLATGSGYYQAAESREELPTNFGRVQLWNAATGELMDRYDKPIGRVRSVNFNSDGKTIRFEAENFSRDIS